MNKYFCSIGKPYKKVYPIVVMNAKMIYLKGQYMLFLFPCNTNELAREIKIWNPKKACGADDVGAKLIQACQDILLII